MEPKPDGRMVATKVNGTYWMYWGENDIHVATSDDLYNWIPLLSDDPTHEYRGRPDHQDLPSGAAKPISVLTPRRGKFDSNLVEPGPPAILRDDGILFIYNSKNTACDKEENFRCKNGESDPDLAPGTYSAGQALFSRTDPTKLLKRSEQNFFKPTEEFEITGQVGNVCFLEGLVFFNNKWLLYYGTADSKIAVADNSDFDYTGKKDPRKRGSSSKKPMFQPVRDNFSPEEVSNRVYKNQQKSSSSTSSSKLTQAAESSKSSLHTADVADVTTAKSDVVADTLLSSTTTETTSTEKPSSKKKKTRKKSNLKASNLMGDESTTGNNFDTAATSQDSVDAASTSKKKEGGEDDLLL